MINTVDLPADMAELADALDLGSSGQPPCRFKSCYPHQKVLTPTMVNNFNPVKKFTSQLSINDRKPVGRCS